jgi:hypothetical protein
MQSDPARTTGFNSFTANFGRLDPQNVTAGLDATSPAVVWFGIRLIAMPTAVIPIVVPVAAIVPTPTPVAIVIMAVAMAGRHDHDGPWPVTGRPPDHGRRTVWPGNGHHHRGEDRPGHHDHRRRANGWRGRTEHPRRRREAEGDAEVEVRPRRGGDCKPEGEGTDSDYGFGFHNGSFDEGPGRRFEARPSIELIAGLSPARSTSGRELAGLLELEDVGTDADPVARPESDLNLGARVVQKRAIGGVQIKQPVIARLIGAIDRAVHPTIWRGPLALRRQGLISPVPPPPFPRARHPVPPIDAGTVVPRRVPQGRPTA